MVDHNRYGQTGEQAVGGGIPGEVDVKLEVPAERLDPVRQAQERGPRGLRVVRHGMQSDALETYVVQLGELLVGRGVVDECDAAPLNLPRSHRCQQSGMVGAIGARLHQHGPRATEGSQHAHVVFVRRRGGEVAGGRDQRVTVAWTEHVGVAVARAWRQAQPRATGCRIGWRVNHHGRHGGHGWKVRVGTAWR